MRALRSLAFGIAVLLTMLLLLLANVGVWAFSRLLEPSALARTASTALRDPAVRGLVSSQVGEGIARAVLESGPLPGPVRRLLDLPARPSEAALAAALTERIDALLADTTTTAARDLAASAFGQVAGDVLQGAGATDPDWAERGLVVDLTPLGRLVLDLIDPSGGLGTAIPPGAATIRLLDGPVLSTAARAVRLLDALRWLLPLACITGVITILVLARYRVHALAWVGLCGVVAGTVSLLVASGAPVIASRATAVDPGRAGALAAALDEVTAGLVTQSAALAGLGLALVVTGIAGGAVVAHGDREPDPHHGWDAGRLS